MLSEFGRAVLNKKARPRITAPVCVLIRVSFDPRFSGSLWILDPWFLVVQEQDPRFFASEDPWFGFGNVRIRGYHRQGSELNNNYLQCFNKKLRLRFM